jgi:histidine ammonia-lyase
VTAAALVAENKALAAPCSIDSIPTSANQEDHVSMATHAARRLGEMARNVAAIVAIELLAATRGIAFRRPLRTSPTLEHAMAIVAPSGLGTGDRYLSAEIERVADLVLAGTFTPMVASLFATVA